MLNRVLQTFYNVRQHRLRAGWRLLIHLVATVFILFASYIALGVITSIAGIPADGSVFFYLASLVQSSVLIATVFFASWLIDRRRPQGLGIDRLWASEMLGGWMLGAIAMLGIFAIELVLGWISIDRVGTSATLTIAALAKSQAGWCSLMILVGVSEELLSRGYHLKNMSEGFRWMGTWRSVVLASLFSSLFFGMLHAMNPNSSWISSLGVTLAGIMLATGRIATGSLAAPIGMHISWNLFQGPILGFPVSGNPTENSFVALTQGGDPFWTGGEFGPEAGLLGVVATLMLLATFLVWGRWKNQSTKFVATLTHFQDGRPSWRRRIAAPESVELTHIMPPIELS